jgi:hypothetical protein
MHLTPLRFLSLSALFLSTCALLSIGCGDSTSSGGAGGSGGQGGAGGGGLGGLGEGGSAGADVEPVEGVDFDCGGATCNSAEGYCYFSEEAPDKEGNTNDSIGCAAFPDECLLDPSCACLELNGANFECCNGDVSTGILAQNPHGGC